MHPAGFLPCSIADGHTGASGRDTGPRLANGSTDQSGVRMTAPIASLFAAPLEVGGQGVAPALGPPPDSDNVFAALVSALFDATDNPPSAAELPAQPQSPLLLLPQSQIPQIAS